MVVDIIRDVVEGVCNDAMGFGCCVPLSCTLDVVLVGTNPSGRN